MLGEKMKEKFETKRLVIRMPEDSDGEVFASMAVDGSLHDIGFDADCGSWMKEWIVEAKEFARRGDPCKDYIAYTMVRSADSTVVGSVGCSYYEDLNEVGITYFVGAEFRGCGYGKEAVDAFANELLKNTSLDHLIATIREENIPSWHMLEKTEFVYQNSRMYQDIDDDAPVLYRFYRMNK